MRWDIRCLLRVRSSNNVILFPLPPYMQNCDILDNLFWIYDKDIMSSKDRHQNLPPCRLIVVLTVPDSKVHGACMWLSWGRQDPGDPHVGPMNLAIMGSNWHIRGWPAVKEKMDGELQPVPMRLWRLHVQYIPRNMHTVLLCFAVLWLCNRS